MHELLLNQIVMYAILLLNVMVVGHIVWFAINITGSRLIRFITFSLGFAYAISIGGIFKAPGFIVNPEVVVFWLFLNAIVGLYIFLSLFKTLNIPKLLTYATLAMALIGSYTVFTGILEFGMVYMPRIMFFTIGIGSGVALVLYQIKMCKEQRMQKRASYILAGLIFSIVCLNAFDRYELERTTAYTGVSEGWEGGITEQQDELSN